MMPATLNVKSLLVLGVVVSTALGSMLPSVTLNNLEGRRLDEPAQVAADPATQTWTNPDGGNLKLEAHSERITWGDQRPGDVMLHLHDICQNGTQSCGVDPIEINTQVVVGGNGGKNWRRTLRVTVVDSTFADSNSPGSAQNIVAALEAYLRDPNTHDETTMHWDQDTENASCQNYNDAFCWIPNTLEGDILQYNAPKELAVRYDLGPDQTLISNIHLKIETVDDNKNDFDCSKIFDTAAEVADAVGKVPSAGFKVFSLACGFLWGV